MQIAHQVTHTMRQAKNAGHVGMDIGKASMASISVITVHFEEKTPYRKTQPAFMTVYVSTLKCINGKYIMLCFRQLSIFRYHRGFELF